MESAEKTVITMIYQVFTDDGRIIDQAYSDEPFSFVVGSSGLPPEVENKITALAIGEAAEFPLPPRSLSGEAESRETVVILRSALPDGALPMVGAGLWLDDEKQGAPVWIVAVDGETVTLSPTHPFDELDVRVKVQILDVQPTEA